ncbi:pyridoxamine 5'-phosphate oxidase-domain-containing protein [Naematelia encephala]|uniref:Pyridoxamine 5'-phosphate oxidase-domain-containing protein n=1 Tax=Naematelia encephala TaxID=71784 RepID=A0A1Y2BAI5_9TREE|nr:pyridoxamine 5'-phosphate oxidase-domain-containing protein [Naematelia encephala]
MRVPTAIAIIVCAVVSCLALPSQQPEQARETVQEAASFIKHLVNDVTTGTLASVFPSHSPDADRPFALMEYHAPCHPSPSLTFLLFPISLSTRNILSTPSQYASYTVQSLTKPHTSAMSQGRVAFIGNMTILDNLSTSESRSLQDCYRSYHPDAWWFPHDQQHPFDSMWARFDPVDIYYVGGFGDTHYIGHVPVDMYAKAH